MSQFESINRGYNRVFQSQRLSLGLVVPIENYDSSAIPLLTRHLERVQLAERLGFKAVWIRDVPFYMPSFGDAGQTFDPFTYLGYLAGHTSEIALGVSSIALPLHHPVHVAKSAATIDQLSKGRLILGVASGDRPGEYPAMNIDFNARGKLFRDAFGYIREVHKKFPTLVDNQYGQLTGQMDVLPKSFGSKIPMIITGSSRQSIEWIAAHGDGWMYYPRPTLQQAATIADWRQEVAKHATFDKPFMQPLYVILEDNDDFRPQPIQLGFRIGAKYLVDYLIQMQEIGVNHVAINLRFNQGDVEAALEKLAEKVFPYFDQITKHQEV